jgi:hypothetical protein
VYTTGGQSQQASGFMGCKCASVLNFSKPPVRQCLAYFRTGAAEFLHVEQLARRWRPTRLQPVDHCHYGSAMGGLLITGVCIQ